MPDNEKRCLASAVMPTPYRELKRCQLDIPHTGKWHRWAETSEGHNRVPLIVEWDDHRCVKVIQGEAT